MKQHITVEQLNELTDRQRDKLRDWWEPRKGDIIYCEPLDPDEQGRLDIYFSGMRDDFRIDLNNKKMVSIANNQNVFTLDNLEWNHSDYKAFPLLSVGQMIEFLSKKEDVLDRIKYDGVYFKIKTIRKEWSKASEELCDALWEAVKSIL